MILLISYEISYVYPILCIYSIYYRKCSNANKFHICFGIAAKGRYGRVETTSQKKLIQLMVSKSYFFGRLLRAGVKNVIFLSTKDVISRDRVHRMSLLTNHYFSIISIGRNKYGFAWDRSRAITSFTGIIIKFKSPCRKVNLE